MTSGPDNGAGMESPAPSVRRLPENAGLAFPGESHRPTFAVPARQARSWLAMRNPDGRPNADVVRPLAGIHDLLRAPRGRWVVAFPSYMDEREAALYVRPFAWVRRRVESTRGRWWRTARPQPAMRAAVVKGDRYLTTPAAGRSHVFAWLPPEVVPDRSLVVFARDDDWFFGVLQSRAHRLWVRSAGGSPRRYRPASCCETFPFPWAPATSLGQLTREQDEQRMAIAQAARTLALQRTAWLADRAGSQRGLATLHARCPPWLEALQAELDEAVFAAYGWPAGLDDPGILARLSGLNHARAAIARSARPLAF